MGRRVAIVGVGQTKYVSKRKDVNTPELANEAVVGALQDAGLKISEIESTIFASAPEAFEGINCPDKWCVGGIGAANKPFMRINTGGMTGGSGFIAAFDHISSGMFDVVMVVAIQRVGESPDAQRILSTIFDPIYEKDIALNIISVCALQATRHMAKYGTTEEQMAKIVVRCHKNAQKNPYSHLKLNITVEDVLRSKYLCWPIKLLDACPRSDGACAVILASEEKAKKITPAPAWVNGLASITESYYVGDRLGWRGGDDDFTDGNSLRIVSKKAYQMAGIINPLEEVDVAEIYAPFSNLEIMDIEALGFCERGKGGEFIDKGIPEIDGKLPINPSGGVLTSNPIGATALIRIAEAALQVMGKAGEHQIADVKTALARTAGGTNQFHNVVILGRNAK